MLAMAWADLRRYFAFFAILVFLIASVTALAIFVNLQERAVRLGSAAAADKFDIVIGASGSETQLVLSSVFLQPNQLGLVSGEILDEIKANPDTKWASPIGFGDYYDAKPIIGVSVDFITNGGEEILQSGRNFENIDEAVVGAKTGLKIGDIITPQHGRIFDPSAHSHDDIKYVVVGVKKLERTAWDRAILVPIEAVWEAHDMAADKIGSEIDSGADGWLSRSSGCGTESGHLDDAELDHADHSQPEDGAINLGAPNNKNINTSSLDYKFNHDKLSLNLEKCDKKRFYNSCPNSKDDDHHSDKSKINLSDEAHGYHAHSHFTKHDCYDGGCEFDCCHDRINHDNNSQRDKFGSIYEGENSEFICKCTNGTSLISKNQNSNFQNPNLTNLDFGNLAQKKSNFHNLIDENANLNYSYLGLKRANDEYFYQHCKSDHDRLECANQIYTSYHYGAQKPYLCAECEVKYHCDHCFKTGACSYLNGDKSEQLHVHMDDKIAAFVYNLKQSFSNLSPRISNNLAQNQPLPTKNLAPKPKKSLQILASKPSKASPAIIIKPKTFAGAYTLRQLYRDPNRNIIGVFPGEVLVKLYTTLGDVKSQLSAISLALWALALIVVCAVSFIYIAQKRQFIAALRAFGANVYKIMFFIWLELCFIVLVGVMLGAILGYFGALLLSKYIGSDIGFELIVEFKVQDLYFILKIIAISAVCFIVPIIKIYKIQVTNLLRE